MMQIGRDRVAGPDHDVFRMHEALGIDAAGRADSEQPGGRRARGAEGLLVHRRAETVEERIAGIDALHQAHIAEIGIGHDRLATIGRNDLAPAPADFGDRLVPGDARELPGPFRTYAAQRIKQPVGIGVMVVKILEFHAQTAAGHRVLFVAPDLDQPAVLDLVDHGAGVRAIVRTCAEKRLACRLFVHVRPSSSRPAALLFPRLDDASERTGAASRCRWPRLKDGADGGSRTLTPLREQDFKSCVSTISTTSAYTVHRHGPMLAERAPPRH